MRIQHNIPAMNAYRNYSNNTSMVNKNLEKLSSGYKINKAGDDAAGLAVSQKMRLQITGLEQAQTNAKSAINYIQTAEGALTEVHDMLERMYTLAEQSANGTFDSTTDRNQIQKEVESLQAEIERIGQTANFNGLGIFEEYQGENAPDAGVTFWIGAEFLTGEENKLTIGQMNLALDSITIDDDATSKGSVSSLVVTPDAGNVSTVDVTSADSAMSQLDIIKGATNSVSNMRGALGAMQNRLEHTLNNLSVNQENMQDAESVIRDTDVAKEMMSYTKNNILIQSAQAMLAQANQLPQGVLQLLQ